MSNDSFHYSNAARQQIGPVTRAQLQQAMLGPAWFAKAMIWQEGWDSWLPWVEAANRLGLRLPTATTGQAMPPIPMDESAGIDESSPASAEAPLNRGTGNVYAPPIKRQSRCPPEQVIRPMSEPTTFMLRLPQT